MVYKHVPISVSLHQSFDNIIRSQIQHFVQTIISRIFLVKLTTKSRPVKIAFSLYNKYINLSCQLFDVMDDIINIAKIDAKHSNEDQIAPFPVWVEKIWRQNRQFWRN